MALTLRRRAAAALLPILAAAGCGTVGEDPRALPTPTDDASPAPADDDASTTTVVTEGEQSGDDTADDDAAGPDESADADADGDGDDLGETGDDPGDAAGEGSPETLPTSESTVLEGVTVAANGAPVAGPGTAELAAQIDLAERTIRDPEATAEQLALAGHLHQVAIRKLSHHPGWDSHVLARLDDETAWRTQRNLDARREFLDMSRSGRPENVPAWEIIEPEPAESLLSYYREGEATYGVDWEVLAAINLVETGMGRIRGLSTAGAQGPMQFIPPTWDAFGEGDVNDPHDAILAAARYLDHSGFAVDPADAIWHYNNHTNYVRAVQAYADIMRRDPAAYTGFYHWRIYYFAEVGDLWLPVGYRRTEAGPAADYLLENPQAN
ncbi:MAG: lytic transglycosylase domain-containing protein [Actinomycetota bacterium]|nr:lytic transglycosylase domain-containing protein [Actinomycetota bacterium]